MPMQPPPTMDGYYIDGCKEPLVNEMPTHFVRLSTFQSSMREGPSSIFLPTTLRTRDQEACNFKRGTKYVSDVDCEVFRSPVQTYGEAYYNTNVSEDLFTEQYNVIDPLRHVLLIAHAPAIGQLTPHTKSFRSDYTQVKGFARWQGSGEVEELKECANTSEVVQEVRAGQPARSMSNKYDYLPLPWVMKLAGITHNCSSSNEDLTYVPLMNGMSIHVNVRYSNLREWTPLGSRDLDYVITADAVRHSDLDSLDEGEKEDTSIYWEDANFERTASTTMKLYGIRVLVATSAEISYFDPAWISASFLPQFLALITVATSIIRSFILYGGSIGGLGIFFSACNLCRPSRTFNQLCAVGSRTVWYYKYLMNTTPNLAAIDFMLRCLGEQSKGEIKQGDLVSAADAYRFKGDKGAFSAFNDPYGLVLNDLPDHEMEVQLYKFYKKHKSRMTSDGRRMQELRLASHEASEYSSDEDIHAATTSVELQTAFRFDKDDARIVHEREVVLFEDEDENEEDESTP